VIDFTDYYMWRRTLEEEALVDAENNLSTYYETKIEDKRELTADELRRVKPEKATVKKRKGDVEGRELLTQDEWEV
jgi:ABC-type siderophore export system fused ATPase/permease subunit